MKKWVKWGLAGDKGFTFIETVVTIGIILTLSAVVGFSALRYIDSAKLAACKNQIETFRLALQSYYLECGVYPSQSQGLQALWEKPVIAPVPARWDGPYLDKQVPRDPWGNDYVYKNPGENNLPWSVASLGADGKEGGEGQDTDIASWQ
jgi:general secretion pathway protein G